MEAKKLGMKLVVVGPRKTKVAQEADIWVPVRPRTSGALALGMANVIIRGGLYDQNFVDAKGHNAAAYMLFANQNAIYRAVLTGKTYPVKAIIVQNGEPLLSMGGAKEGYQAFHSSNLHQISFLRDKYPDPLVWIHPETAARHGILPGDWVIIERPEGKIRQKAFITDMIRNDTIHPEGYWWYPEQKPGEPGLSGLWEANANAITPTDIELCSFAGDQPLRGGRCRITPADHPGPFTGDLIAGFQATYDDLDRMLRYLDKDSISRFNANSDNTMADMIDQLREMDIQNRDYIQKVMAQPKAAILPDTIIGSVKEISSSQQKTILALDKLWASRQLTLDMITRLSSEEFSLCINHSSLGEITVESLLWNLACNEAKHTEQIRQMILGMNTIGTN
jgi:hypothetical protein